MFPTFPFLASGFLNAGFAWAGAALVAIPIIIHLLNRRRFRTMTWAAMEFLLRAMRKNRRRLKFEQWLLLATRCLLIALLGMALARPLGCESSALHAFGRHTALNVFVIDNGYTAGYEANHPNAKTHLDQAKRLVTTILSRPNSGGETVVVITADRPASPVIRAQTDMQSAIAAVGRIQQSNGATDLASALQRALKIAREEDAQPNKNLFIITAGTRSTWEGRQSMALQQLGPELAAAFKVTHYNLSDGQAQWNGAILDIKPTDNLVSTKYAANFSADVKGYGTSHDGTLKWILDGEELPKAGGSVKLDAATGAQTVNDVQFTAGGPHVLVAQLNDGDNLNTDNFRGRVVDVASELKVLIVEGRRGISPLDGSAAFLATALQPRFNDPKARSNSYVSAEVISDLELGTKVLGDYAAVALAGVGQITSAEADSLEKYVKQGGSLILFMGPEVSKENYNTLLLPRKLLPGPLVKMITTGVNQQPYNFAFNPKGLLHPYLHVFADQTDTGLDTARIETYWQVDVARTSAVERVLNYKATDAKAEGDPAITVQTLGDGRVVFDSTSANDDWNALPSREAYVPLMTELLSGSIRAGDWWLNREVGQAIEIPSTIRLSSAPTLADAFGKPVVIDPETQDGHVVYRTQPMRKPGMYVLSLGDRKFPIAVNVPAAESADVTVIKDDAIRKALGDINMSMQKADVSVEARSSEEGNDFSWWTMMIVLALVGFECFIAMRFGHYRQSLIAPGGTGKPTGRAMAGAMTAGAVG